MAPVGARGRFPLPTVATPLLDASYILTFDHESTNQTTFFLIKSQFVAERNLIDWCLIFIFCGILLSLIIAQKIESSRTLSFWSTNVTRLVRCVDPEQRFLASWFRRTSKTTAWDIFGRPRSLRCPIRRDRQQTPSVKDRVFEWIWSELQSIFSEEPALISGFWPFRGQILSFIWTSSSIFYEHLALRSRDSRSTYLSIDLQYTFR